MDVENKTFRKSCHLWIIHRVFWISVSPKTIVRRKTYVAFLEENTFFKFVRIRVGRAVVLMMPFRFDIKNL